MKLERILLKALIVEIPLLVVVLLWNWAVFIATDYLVRNFVSFL